jgi:hypothetical protein
VTKHKQSSAILRTRPPVGIFRPMRIWVYIAALFVWMIPRTHAQSGACLERAGQLTGGDRCTAGAWQAPVYVGPELMQLSIRNAHVAVHGQGTMIVGQDVLSNDSRPITPDMLVAISVDGRDIGRPPGEWIGMFPRAVFRTSNELHMVWGEPAEGAVPELLTRLADDGESLRHPRINIGALRSVALVHAHYTESSGWSDPETIIEARLPIDWHRDGGALAADADGRVHLIVGANPRLMHFVWDVGVGWTGGPVQLALGAVYSSATVLTDGSIVTAYVGPGNQLFAMHGVGTTWQQPVRLPMAEESLATTTRVFQIHGDMVAVASLVIPPGDENNLHVDIAVSRDQGRSWIGYRPLRLPPDAQHVRFAADGCGAVHVVYSVLQSSSEPNRLVGQHSTWYARWAGDWQEPMQILESFNVINTALAVDESGGLLLVAGMRPVSEIALHPPFRTMVARLEVHPD